MPKKSAKRAAKAPAKRKPKAHPKTTCGSHYLVPNGDGTAKEVLVPTPGA